MFQLFPNAWCLRCKFFNPGKFLNCLLILLLRQVNITTFQINFDVVLVHINCLVEDGQRVVILTYFRKSTSRIVKNGYVERVVKGVKTQTLVVKSNCCLNITYLICFCGLVFESFSLLNIFPKLLQLFGIRIH